MDKRQILYEMRKRMNAAEAQLDLDNPREYNVIMEALLNFIIKELRAKMKEGIEEPKKLYIQ